MKIKMATEDWRLANADWRLAAGNLLKKQAASNI